MNETQIPPVSPSQPKSSGLAVASLVLGILSLVACSLFTGIPAIICGHMGKSRIKRSGGWLTGDGLALAGLIMGYISVAFGLILIPMMLAIAIPNFVKARETAQRNACINNLRQIDGATEQWALEKRKDVGTTVTEADVTPYIRDGFPICPTGGRYTIGPVGKPPTCTQPRHVLAE